MWKTIQKEPAYEISSEGLIRNKKTKHVKSTRLSRAGYPRVTLYPSGKTYTVHRLIAEQFIANPNKHPFINHINGVKKDNSIDNLEWCTAKHNTKHAIESGLMQTVDWSGEKNPASKLDRWLVKSIRKGYLSSFSVKQISNMLGLGEEAIRKARNLESWTHIV